MVVTMDYVAPPKDHRATLSGLPKDLQAVLFGSKFGHGRLVSTNMRETLNTHTLHLEDPTRALHHFRELATTGHLNEKLMCSLVSDDRLWMEGGEDDILDCVEAWMRANHHPGLALLACIRLGSLSKSRREQALLRWPHLAHHAITLRLFLQPTWSSYTRGLRSPLVLDDVLAMCLSKSDLVYTQPYGFSDELKRYDATTKQWTKLVSDVVLSTPQRDESHMVAVGPWVVTVQFTGTLHVWDTRGGTHVDVVRDTLSKVQCVASCYPYFAIGCIDGKVKIWDVRIWNDSLWHACDGAYSLAMCQDFIICGGFSHEWGGPAIHIYDFKKKHTLHEIRYRDMDVNFLIHDKTLYSTHVSKNDLTVMIRVWTLRTWELVSEHVVSLKQVRAFSSLAMLGPYLLCGVVTEQMEGLLAVIHARTSQVDHVVHLPGIPEDLICLPGKVFCKLEKEALLFDDEIRPA